MPRSLDSLPSFDPFNADWLRDPFEVVGRELATDDWCALGPMGTLFVWSYTGVMDLAESEGWHAPSVEETSLGQITSGHAAEFAQNVTSFLEGDRRRRIRTALAMPLAPAEVERFRSTIAATAARLVSEVDPPFDLVKLCYRLPVEVFASTRSPALNTGPLPAIRLRIVRRTIRPSSAIQRRSHAPIAKKVVIPIAPTRKLPPATRVRTARRSDDAVMVPAPTAPGSAPARVNIDGDTHAYYPGQCENL